MQLPGSATLTSPVSWTYRGVGLFRLRLYHLLVLRCFVKVDLVPLILSYWEELVNR